MTDIRKQDTSAKNPPYINNETRMMYFTKSTLDNCSELSGDNEQKNLTENDVQKYNSSYQDLDMKVKKLQTCDENVREEREWCRKMGICYTKENGVKTSIVEPSTTTSSSMRTQRLAVGTCSEDSNTSNSCNTIQNHKHGSYARYLAKKKLGKI